MDWGFRILIANMLVILVGGSIALFMYFVDGVYVRPIVTYTNGVDPLNLVLEKHEYKLGEPVRYYVAFCKNREAQATVNWYLTNNIRIAYTPREGNAPVGCVPEGLGKIVAQAPEIPMNTPVECGYRLEGNIVRDIGGGRLREQTVRTEEFCVVE